MTATDAGLGVVTQARGQAADAGKQRYVWAHAGRWGIHTWWPDDDRPCYQVWPGGRVVHYPEGKPGSRQARALKEARDGS